MYDRGMKKATDALLADHKMIRKLLDSFELSNPRFSEIKKTLTRVTLTHAWFEDAVFLPAFEHEPLLIKRYMDELYQEHKDIDHFLSLILKAAPAPTVELEATLQQFRAIMLTHLDKEEDALFPLAAKILNEEGQNKLGSEMERRAPEAQKLFS
jgi:hemerythrin-like domain-containing protein